MGRSAQENHVRLVMLGIGKDRFRRLAVGDIAQRLAFACRPYRQQIVQHLPGICAGCSGGGVFGHNILQHVEQGEIGAVHFGDAEGKLSNSLGTAVQGSGKHDARMLLDGDVAWNRFRSHREHRDIDAMEEGLGDRAKNVVMEFQFPMGARDQAVRLPFAGDVENFRDRVAGNQWNELSIPAALVSATAFSRVVSADFLMPSASQ